MAKLNVVDLTGATVGEVEVSDEIFAAEVKEHLLWEAVRAQRAAKRQGTACTKTRAEVNITKAKIYRQKGTGNARHGSRRANLFRGGGVVHGPRPRKYRVGINKKAMAGALRSALSLRAKAGDLVVVRAFEGEQPKTKILAKALEQMSARRALLVDVPGNEWLKRTSRNLQQAAYLPVPGLNVYDVLRYPKLLISESCVRDVEARLARKRQGTEGSAA